MLMYKKQWCKYKNTCKYKDDAYLCKYAHYKEEKKCNPVYMPSPTIDEEKWCRMTMDDRRFGDWLESRGYISYMYKSLPRKPIIPVKYTIRGNAGTYQLLKSKLKSHLGQIVISFLETDTVLKYSNTLDTCKKCRKIFSYIYDYDYMESVFHEAHHERNNPFICYIFRKICNIGPLCLDCALYKIPIRCDICEKYTNSNNMTFKYNILDDCDVMHIFKRRNVIHINTDKLYDKPYNFCTRCIISYYGSLMPSDITLKKEITLIQIIERRYGDRMIIDWDRRLTSCLNYDDIYSESD